MFSFALVSFGYSLFLAFTTICYGLVRMGFRGKEIFFAFFPAALLYIGSIATALSFTGQLTNSAFLIAQGVLVICIFADITFHNIHVSLSHITRILQLIRQRFVFPRSGIVTACLTMTLALVLISFLLRIVTPINEYDDKMYRASTPLYWIQSQSVFRFESVNERNNVFAQGASLIYLWPNLFNTGEQAANIFYWLALPLSLLGIYLFTGLFTKQPKIRAVTMLLLASTPIIIRYFTFTLVQESWLGLLVLCFLYFLITEIRLPRIQPHISFAAGIALGALFFIKPTALIYLAVPLVVLTVEKNKAARIIWLAAGIIFFTVFSGHGLLIYQNIVLYGNAFGTEAFQQLHMPYPSFKQAVTHLVRFPFALLEFPVFFPQIAAALESWLQHIAVFFGATTELYEETQKVWLGVYRYQLTTPNTRFGLGGFLWLALFLMHTMQLFRLRNTTNDHKREYGIYTILLIAVLVQIVQIRWAELSGTPYRHLLSYFVAVTAFFPLYLTKIYRHIGKPVATLFVIVLLAATGQLIFINIGHLKNTWGGSPEAYAKAKFLMQTSPYSEFMATQQGPTSLLLVGVENTLDYPLFANHLRIRNLVYRMHNAHGLPDNVFFSKLDEFVRTNKVEYVVLYNQPEELIRLMEAHKGYILRYTIQAADDVTFSVFLNAAFRKH